jgi:hypothetical protein
MPTIVQLVLTGVLPMLTRLIQVDEETFVNPSTISFVKMLAPSVSAYGTSINRNWNLVVQFNNSNIHAGGNPSTLTIELPSREKCEELLKTIGLSTVEDSEPSWLNMDACRYRHIKNKFASQDNVGKWQMNDPEWVFIGKTFDEAVDADIACTAKQLGNVTTYANPQKTGPLIERDCEHEFETVGGRNSNFVHYFSGAHSYIQCIKCGKRRQS